MEGKNWRRVLLLFLTSTITAIFCQNENQSKHQSSVDDSQVEALLENVLQEINQIRNQLDQVQAENEILKSKFEKDNKILTSKVSSLQGTHQNMTNFIESLVEIEMEKLKASLEMDSKIQAMNRNFHQENVFINFRAHASVHHVYQDGDVVMFDAVHVNEGNHYIVENSTFVCPYTGEYMFIVTQFTQSGKLMRSHLMQEENILHATYGNDPATYDQSTAVVVTRCTPRDRVWVQARVFHGEDGGHVYDSTTPYTTFAGFLLKEHQLA